MIEQLDTSATSALVWCLDSDALENELAGVEVQSIEVSPDSETSAEKLLSRLRSAVDETIVFDAAVAKDVLETMPPNGLIEVLRWLQERIAPGARLTVRVCTDLIGEPPGEGRARLCAATYMTAFRRAGFWFDRLERTLVDDDDPALERALERMPFHDPLELRTRRLDAILIRPDRVDLDGLELTGQPPAGGNASADFSAARKKWPRAREKRTAEWGRRRGQSLWENQYAPWIDSADGSSFLDVGCSWGYLFEYMLDRCAPQRLIGVDVRPHWLDAPFDWEHETRAQVELIHGDVFSPRLEGGSFDYILCSGVLQFLPPTQLDATLRRMRQLLRPGGEALLGTQTFTAHTGLHVHRLCEQPYVHLLHGEELLMRRIEASGRRRPPFGNWLTTTSYLSMFTAAGFEVRDVQRTPNSYSPAVQARILAEFPVAREELCVDYLTVRLRRETD